MSEESKTPPPETHVAADKPVAYLKKEFIERLLRGRAAIEFADLTEGQQDALADVLNAASEIVEAILHRAPPPVEHVMPQLGGSPEDLRNTLCAVIELFGIDGAHKVTQYVLRHRGINAFNGEVCR